MPEEENVIAQGFRSIAVGSDGTVKMWNRQGQPLAQPFQGHQGYVVSVAISPDGQTTVICNYSLVTGRNA